MRGCGMLWTWQAGDGGTAPSQQAGGTLLSRAGLLGVALGRPVSDVHGEEADAGTRAGRRAATSECGAMYLAGPWLELHEHVAEQLGAEAEGAQPAAVGWAEMQRGFMDARDYTMLFLDVALCKRHGDNETSLATADEVEALLSRDWSGLLVSP